MKNIIDLAFLYEIKYMKNVNIEKELKRVQKDINKRIDDFKFTKQFMAEFISMYDEEQLCKIIAVIQKEIQKRSRDEINNMI